MSIADDLMYVRASLVSLNVDKNTKSAASSRRSSVSGPSKKTETKSKLVARSWFPTNSMINRC